MTSSKFMDKEDFASYLTTASSVGKGESKGQCPETKNKLEIKIMRRWDLKDNGSHIYTSTEND